MYYSSKYSLTIAVLAIFSISGCAFKTDQYSHAILVSPADRAPAEKYNSIEPKITYDYKLKFDGYIIGIEKSRGIGDYLTKCSDSSFEDKNSKLCETVSSHSHSIWLPDFLEKRMIITHAISFSSSEEESNSPCILFSAYGNIQKNNDLTPCRNASINSESDKFEYMKEAINSISKLKDDIRLKIKQINPSHIFLVSTGWNTAQGESILNYNDLFKNIKVSNKNKERFVPLIIGFSWKSYMDNANQGTVDVGVVGNDADEVGIFWAGPILHDVLEPLGTEYDIPIRLIGHSFGCRVVTQALSSKNLYKTETNYKKPVSYGLQCAFSGNRFATENSLWEKAFGESDSLEDFNAVSEKQFFTTSSKDKAVQKAAEVGVPYVGSDEFFKIAGEDPKFKNIITESTIQAPSVYAQPLDCKGDKITLIDASKIIKDQAPGTGEGGGAHSDVWDAEAGELIWDLLKICENNGVRQLP